MPSSISISTIIPVFNGGAYLAECLDSILEQSLDQFEIIIIDDGSTDDSWGVIQEYSERHENIRGFQQDRKRQGAARNIGLENAKGVFISFVDADDMLPSDAYESMHKLAMLHNSDIVTGIKKSFDKKHRLLKNEANWITIPEHEKYFTQIMPDIRLGDLPEMLVDISVCNKLFKRSFIEKHQLRFIENSAGEDIEFMTCSYLAAEHITVIPKVIYHYCSRPNSRTSRISPEFFNDRVSVTLSLESAFEKNNYSDHFSLLVLSEARKLVGNRLTRVVKQLSFAEQRTVFQTIRELLEKLHVKDVTTPKISLLPIAEARILMLLFSEFDVLVSLTNEPESNRYISFFESDEAKSHLLAPLLTHVRPERPKAVRVSDLLSNVKLTVSSATALTKKYLSKLFGGSGRKALAYAYYMLLLPYAFIYSKYKSGEDNWLIDERLSTSAEDNSYFLFEYLRTNFPDLKVYYIIEKCSPDRSRVTPLGNTVSLYSFRHAFLLSRASVLISTDRFTSLAYPYNIFPRLRRNTHNVFLQHGVAGNKTMTYTKKNYPYFSQVITSNSIEKDFFVKDYYFAENEVTVTGIARFDKLEPTRQKTRSRKILIAPTWRKWLRDSSTIGASEYLYAWNQLMTNSELDDLAGQHEVQIYFRPHFNMVEYIGEFATDSKHIHILTEKDLFLQKYIQECDLLITDYSSVMYDFFYQDKPAICYMFDRRQWELQPPGPPHISFDDDLPADIVTTSKYLIDSLAWHLENDFDMRKEYKSRNEKMFAYRDNSNCKRIYRSILELTADCW